MPPSTGSGARETRRDGAYSLEAEGSCTTSRFDDAKRPKEVEQ